MSQPYTGRRFAVGQVVRFKAESASTWYLPFKHSRVKGWVIYYVGERDHIYGTYGRRVSLVSVSGTGLSRRRRHVQESQIRPASACRCKELSIAHPEGA